MKAAVLSSLVVLLFITFSLPAFSGSTPNTLIDRLGLVEPDLLRGSFPDTMEKMKELRQRRVRTIVNMSEDEEVDAFEREAAAALGIKYIHYPLDGWKAPTDEQTAQMQKFMNDKSLRPLYIHCAHGRERTGVMVGLYRVFTNGWDAKKAYKEMKSYGFRPLAFNFTRYFKKKTGL
ncbi:MAG: tyrosine-protein phosphatase [Bdellovibrionota bacterium]